MGIRFIGHKRKLLPHILEVITETVPEDIEWVADLFAGTAAVSAGLKQSGYHVISNDLLTQSQVSARALLCNNPQPQFETLVNTDDEVASASDMFVQRSGYSRVLSYLNQLPGRDGFFYNQYSPGGTDHLEEPRQYFTDKNARKIDACRTQIAEWDDANLLSPAEHALLLYDLIIASNEVANIAGTYGAYLKTWYERAKEPLELTPTDIPSGPTHHEIHQRDANELAREIDADAVYLDPPYTKRQYASYYHIPETIAEEDEPNISGKTGLRPWKKKSSDYCHKRRAGDKLAGLLDSLDAKYVFLSYSDEGHITEQEIVEILNDFGSVTQHRFDHARFKSNTGASSGQLTESVYSIIQSK
ncbi:DNA adenine methylase [Salinigranum sp. GCM10025319]|uniref:DNA adenine methylase n=1 Tax=Salinigranum sp. GCM10025319 TaxID=3252687 RepID=UPI00360A7E70